MPQDGIDRELSDIMDRARGVAHRMRWPNYRPDGGVDVVEEVRELAECITKLCRYLAQPRAEVVRHEWHRAAELCPTCHHLHAVGSRCPHIGDDGIACQCGARSDTPAVRACERQYAESCQFDPAAESGCPVCDNIEAQP